MINDVRYGAEVRRSQKEYCCGAIRPDTCTRKILKGDAYFCLTENSGTHFRTYRYCLDCGQNLYPYLVKFALANAKSAIKRRNVGAQIRRAALAERRSSDLMRRSSPPEKYLWSFLRNKQLGVVFYRQKILRGYIVDFWCPELKLVIELDGRRHLSRKEKDQIRDSILRNQGLTILRFPAATVYTDVSVILDSIRSARNESNKDQRK